MPESELRAPETETSDAPELSNSRSMIVSTVYAVFGLIFFFGVGLAGGGAYRLWANNAADQAAGVSTKAAPPSLASAAPPARITPNDAAPLMPAAPGSTTGPAFVAPQLAQIAPTEPSPNPPKAMAMPAPAPNVLAPNSSAMEGSSGPAPNTASNNAPSAAAPAKPAHPTQLAAVVPPKKPAAAKPRVADRPRPAAAPGDAVALHEPPAAPDNSIGPYRIQFGAFANEENARKVQWAIEATGLNADVTVQTGAGGHALYFVRSPAYPDYAAALSGAQTVQSRVQHFVNAIPIEYVIIGDHSRERSALSEQQAEAH